MNTRKSKPWLHYRENDPVPAHFQKTPKRKSVNYARALLIVFGGFGVQRFYIDEIAAGWRWVSVMFFGPLLIYIALYILSFEFPKFGQFLDGGSIWRELFLLSIYSPFLIWIVLEWRSLPKRVDAWNAKHFVG